MVNCVCRRHKLSIIIEHMEGTWCPQQRLGTLEISAAYRWVLNKGNGMRS